MRLLLDTHVLLWAAGSPERLSSRSTGLLQDPGNQLFFSAASLWEITIKSALQRPDFHVQPRMLRRGLIEHGYEELAITSAHAVALDGLPTIHKDPFDRMLVAQCLAEDMVLLTADAVLAQYPGPIQRV